MTDSMQLTLGPVLYHWKPEHWRDFYARIADEAPIDTVCVGETVCSKRAPFYERFIPDVIDRLERGGKKVLLSSLLLVALERERKQTEALAKQDGYMVEANDISCLLHIDGRPHAIGPFVNTYNEATARYFAARGAARICLPPELPLASIAAIAGGCPDVAMEVFAFGRIPLAISARCYHARLHKLTKDNCQFVCEKNMDGLDVDTLDGEKFLSVNGVQTLSHHCAVLLAEVPALKAAGAAALRLSPQDCDMVAVANLYRAVIDGRRDAASATAELARVYTGAPFANGFTSGAPGAAWKTFAEQNGLAGAVA